ncbi:MAG TPA: hypothetical protein VIV11_20425 [Kofleriaceae bacterium]
MLLPGIAIASVAGCVEEPPPPDIGNLTISMRWKDDTTRSLDVRIANPDIPCTEVEEGFLGDEAVKCVSAPWAVVVDGVELNTEPVTCWSGHETLFGYTPKRCEGGTAQMILQAHTSEHVAVVATTNEDRNEIVLAGVRATHTFIQAMPFQGGAPGVGQVNGLSLVNDRFTAIYSRDGYPQLRGEASRGDADNRLHMSPLGLSAGTYYVRVLALAKQGPATIAVPIEGALTVGP